jgi:heavy metal sensor kinase
MRFSPNLANSYFRSIRFTIFLLYALILFVTFSLFSVSIYLYFQNEIYRKVDALLEVKVGGIEDSIRTYFATRQIDAPSGWAAFFAGSKKEDSFPLIASLLTQSDLSGRKEPLEIGVNIFDSKGLLIASSSKTSSEAPLDRETLRDMRQGRRKIHNLRVLLPDKRHIKARAVTQPVMEKGAVVYVIQTRLALGPVEEELGKLGQALIISIFITLLVASWAGIFLVKVTLRPVDQMVRKIRNVRSDNLDVRLNLPNTNDEIRNLANTFNQMIERLERSFEAQRQIVQDISHELKTPLTILRGQMEVALKRKRPAEEYEELLCGSLGEIENIRKIIDDLLMLARLDSRAAVVDMKSTDLSALLRSVTDDARALALGKNISIMFQCAEKLFIQGNEIHLRRLFVNLLDNAVKYTLPGGTVRLNANPEGEGIRIELEDTGIGIDPEHLPHIFDRFYRVEKAKRDGYGLGLSIVKSIVDAHKGRISVESVPGQGTSFRLFFYKEQAMTLLGAAQDFDFASKSG